MNNKELLDEFIKVEKEKHRAGSGDDEFYANQIEDYVNKQRGFWMGFMSFIKQERNAEVKQAIRKLKVYSIKDKKGNVRDCILVEELLQKLGLGEGE